MQVTILSFMKKDADLRVRLEKADLDRIKLQADAKHLPVATLVRQQLLDAADAWDAIRRSEGAEKLLAGGRRH